MTNREWMSNLLDDELAEIIFNSSDFCDQQHVDCPLCRECSSDCIKEWLREERV